MGGGGEAGRWRGDSPRKKAQILGGLAGCAEVYIVKTKIKSQKNLLKMGRKGVPGVKKSAF
jgi:hypothetical protein